MKDTCTSSHSSTTGTAAPHKRTTECEIDDLTRENRHLRAEIARLRAEPPSGPAPDDAIVRNDYEGAVVREALEDYLQSSDPFTDKQAQDKAFGACHEMIERVNQAYGRATGRPLTDEERERFSTEQLRAPASRPAPDDAVCGYCGSGEIDSDGIHTCLAPASRPALDRE